MNDKPRLIETKAQVIKSDTKLCSYWDYLHPGSYWTAECHNCRQPVPGTSEFCPGCGLRNEGENNIGMKGGDAK